MRAFRASVGHKPKGIRFGLGQPSCLRLCRHPAAALLAGGWLFGIFVSALTAAGEAELPAARPVPAVEVLPLPYDQASFQYQGRELTRYHFGPALVRPFWYPLAGPEGRSLTRMGHPRDPHSHRHHYSVWISHHDVGGVDFWSDNGDGRIVHQAVLQYEDGEREASMVSQNAWQTRQGKTLLIERRRTAVEPLPGGSWRMVLDIELQAPPGSPVTLGQTPFGLIGVRMRKTIGVHDGGGRILNSQGQRNEAQAFRQPARWVDYSGPVTAGTTGGITLMDHPQNPGHPTPFHVRDDGWMGASLTLRGPICLEPGRPLLVRYGLWMHEGVPRSEEVERQYQLFAQQKPATLGNLKGATPQETGAAKPGP